MAFDKIAKRFAARLARRLGFVVIPAWQADMIGVREYGSPLPEHVTRAAAGRVRQLPGKIVNFKSHGRDILFFVIDEHDEISRYHCRGEFCEQEELDIMSRFYTGGAIVDIGANIGNHAVYFSKIFQAPEIFVFEPNPLTVELLKINLALNKCDAVNTAFLGMALGASEARYRAETPDNHNLGHTVMQRADDGDIRSAQGDTVLGNSPIGLIKLDVEGMEMEVLAGLEQTLRRCRPAIFVEVWDDRRDSFERWRESRNYVITERYQRYEGVQNFLITNAG